MEGTPAVAAHAAKVDNSDLSFEAPTGHDVLAVFDSTPVRVCYSARRPDSDETLCVSVYKIETGDPNRILTLQSLSHPHIAVVIEAGLTPQGHVFDVSDGPIGEPITSYCDRMKLSIKQRLRLFEPVCSAAQAAHHAGVIHGHISPATIRVSEKNGQPWATMTGLGAGRLSLDHRESPGACSAPEQLRSGTAIEAHADVYALAAVLYELLCGQPVFKTLTGSPAAARRTILLGRTQTLHKRIAGCGAQASDIAAARNTTRADLTRTLQGRAEWLVMKALHKHPDRRYRTTQDFLEDIRRHLHDLPILARPRTSALTKLTRIITGLVAIGGAAWFIRTFIWP